MTGKQRFAALLEKETSREAAIHDQPLLARPEWIVAPTLGAIVPNWLLLIPRYPVLSFRSWSRSFNQAPETLLRDVQRYLGLRGDEILWFEHGPRTHGTMTGCGIDHAHMHILVRPSFSFQAFAETASSNHQLAWATGPAGSAHDRLPLDRSYLIAGSGDRVITALDVEPTGSQFFRRVVATLANAGERWDYRQHPHSDNVAETIRTFRSLESAAQRDE